MSKTTDMIIDLANKMGKTDAACMMAEIKRTFCCSDMKLSVQDYKSAHTSGDITRFHGAVIYYCPFCGKLIGD